MEFYWLVLGILAVWRVAHLLRSEDGPWDAVVRLRAAAGEGFLGQLLDCFYCLSLWIAAPAAALIADGWKRFLFLWLALSGGAVLLERMTGERGGARPAVYFEDEERDDVLLRRTEEAGRDQRAVVHAGEHSE